MIKAIDLWLPSYVRRESRPAGTMTDLIFCVCDHFEPLHHSDSAGAARRLADWQQRYPEVTKGFVDSDGCTPKHTFFYPVEQYAPELLKPLEGLCRNQKCEVEVHLHHRNDTVEGLTRQLQAGLEALRTHGFLGSDPHGKPAFGFIHGNWALDHSHPDGAHCGVKGELAILKQAGCYGDFTMPSAPDRCQTRRINSLYYAKSTDRPKSHDDGIPVAIASPQGASTARFRDDARYLLLLQGPLGLNWMWRKWGLLPRIENADLTGKNPPTAGRLKLWLDLIPHVHGQSGWRFLKLHTHGAVGGNREMLLGKAMMDFHRVLTQSAKDRPFRLHYVTAREMVNILHAAESGETGDAGRFRDFVYAPPPILSNCQ